MSERVSQRTGLARYFMAGSWLANPQHEFIRVTQVSYIPVKHYIQKLDLLNISRLAPRLFEGVRTAKTFQVTPVYLG